MKLRHEQEVARKPGTPPLARQIRALSLARFALARSLCTVLHLPASLTSRAALTCHSHRPAPSMCPSRSAAPSRTLMLNFLSVCARSHRPLLTSRQFRPAGGSNHQTDAGASQERAQEGVSKHEMEAPREDREKKNKPRASLSVARPLHAALRVSLPHSCAVVRIVACS